MLVAHRHGMDRSSGDSDMPFGYSFGTDINFPFPSPTAPAPGPSLLDDNESKYLDTFFEGVDSNDINYDFFMNVEDAFLNPGWQELPPSFVGTSSSFGQQPPQVHQSHPQPQPQSVSTATLQDANFKVHDVNYAGMNGQIHSPIGLPSSTSPDVMAAAQTLISNGQNGRSLSINHEAMFGMARPTSMMPTNGHGIHEPIFPPRTRSNQDVRPPPVAYPAEAYYRDMIFGGEANHEVITAAANDVLQPEKRREIDIRFGSDAGFFNDQGFAPPPEQETAGEVEREKVRRMREFAHELSMTPVGDSHDSGLSSPQRKKSVSVKTEDEDSRVRKRRKSKYLEDDDEIEQAPGIAVRQAGSSKKRKSIARASDKPSPSPVTETSSKRKKSTGANGAVKPSRENLTEDQKRENHIKSEQKRRTLIREGFEDLGELVPGLRGGGFSKSAILVMAGDWLEDLLKGNELLRSRVDDLEKGR